MEANPDLAKVALVTGAGGGLGSGLVGEFAAQGWRVVAAGHRAPPDLTETELIWPVAMDVTDADQVEAVVKGVLERWGRIDLLINNAGITADGLSWQITEDEWERVLAVNLKGAFLCARAVIRPMLKQREGQIINISSLSGRQGQRGQANYAASKAGLLGLTEALAKEAGTRNVRVNAILPGVLPTPMTAGLGEKVLEEYARANTLGRLNTIAEVARFTVFLAGMKNVSGQVFQLDSRVARWT
jgi:3-oxoacyl-[acyl-carrier protein] reductase